MNDSEASRGLSAGDALEAKIIAAQASGRPYFTTEVAPHHDDEYVTDDGPGRMFPTPEAAPAAGGEK